MTEFGSGMTELGSGMTELGSAMSELGSGMSELGSWMGELGMGDLGSKATRWQWHRSLLNQNIYVKFIFIQCIL